MPGMISKPGWVLAMLAGAFVVPYTLSNKDLRATIASALTGSQPSAPAARSSPQADVASADAPGVPLVPLSPQAPPCDMASALRFDVTPQWVTGTWPRVTTAVADTTYSGLRVPLVTGVMPDDLVGTLTYYFDDEQRVQRITFAGSTADARRLVSLITAQYGLKPQATLDAGLYQSQWNGRVISTLHVRHSSARSATGNQITYDLRLELNRADALAGTASAPRRLFGW